MSDLSHQGAFRLIYKRRLTRAEEDALQSHLRYCSECRHDAEMAGLFSDHLVLKALPTRPSPLFTAVFMEGAARRSRRSHIMKPIYAVGGAVALVLLMLAGWLIIRSNIQNTGLVGAPQLPAVSISESQPAAQPAAPEEAVSQPEIDMAAANEQLVEAVRSNDPAVVAELLEAGADPNAVDDRSNAVLAVAARSGKLEIARMLLDAGADVDGTIIDDFSKEQTSALYQAVYMQHNDMADLLIARGADVNWLWDNKKETWGTPLHAAAWFNNVEMVQHLFDNGADPNLRSKYSLGTTPLHWAVWNQSEEVARMLLDNGAEVDLATDLGVTPLMYMLDPKAGSIRLLDQVALLLEAGADPDLQDKIGQTALHYAARGGREEAVALLIEHGAAVNIANNAGQTPLDLAANDEIVEMLREAGATSSSQADTPIADQQLLVAVLAGDIAKAEQLLNIGADPNFVNSSGSTSLPMAAKAGHLEIVQLLLEAGADVNSTMDFQVDSGQVLVQAPALIHATAGNHIKIVELLIEHGAILDQTEKGYHETALHSAAWDNYVDIINLLLKNGAKPDAVGDYPGGETPLHYAVEAGSFEAAEALLAGGADVNVQIDQQATPLILITKLSKSDDSNTRMIALLLGGGADPNIQDYEGNSALHYAVRESKKEAVELLIEHGALVDLQNNEGQTPLDLAANDEIAAMLGEAGATSGSQAETAALDEQLVEAISSNDLAVAAELLEAGANPDAVDSRGNALLAVAAKSGKLEIVRLLLDAGADVDGTTGSQTTALYEAIHLQHNDVAELLIARGADVNWLWNDAKEISGAPLHIAASFNNVDMVQRLIDNGADPNLRSKWQRGTTPLVWAVWGQSVEVARILLDNGAEVDLATDQGVTPLMFMLRSNASRIRLSDRVTLLLDAGADPDLQDNLGDTALHYAARGGREEAVALLIEHGASLDIKNQEGQTPLEVAANDEIAEMLLQAGAD